MRKHLVFRHLKIMPAFFPRFIMVCFLAIILMNSVGLTSTAQAASVNLNFENIDSPEGISQSLQVLILLTILSLAPSILVLMTSFTRIIIVLGFARNALGTQNMPPNQVLVGLALILSIFLMSPVFTTIYNHAWVEYSAGRIDLNEAARRAELPLKEFMLSQTRVQDLDLFAGLSGEQDVVPEAVPLQYVVPAFVISELKTAFQMGFMIYIPFLIIDMVVASTLMSMGMMMLPPVMISLPFKVLLFTMVDGWHLVVNAILTSFK